MDFWQLLGTVTALIWSLVLVLIVLYGIRYHGRSERRREEYERREREKQ
jgi:hypothetical protein